MLTSDVGDDPVGHGQTDNGEHIGGHEQSRTHRSHAVHWDEWGGAVGFRTREACFESRVWPAKVDALALSLIGFVFILYLCFAKCSGIMELWKYERERERDMERCIFQCRSTFKYRLAELNRVFFMGLYSNLVVL